MKKKVVFLLLLLGIGGGAWAQADSVAVLLQKIKNTGEDSLRLLWADRISGCLEKTAFGELAAHTEIPFLNYRKCVNAAAEMVSWVIPTSGGQTYYNWFRFQDTARTYLLKNETTLRNEPTGWLYYDWVAFQYEKQEYFVLLGWNKTRNTNQKIVRAARFEPDGRVTFDHRLVERGNSRIGFLRFEYALDGSMMLKQDRKGRRIVFDRLVPSEAKYDGYFMFYGPDGSFDALVLDGGIWKYKENVK